MITVKVTCNTGKTWTTGFNGSMQDAERYFLGAVFVDESEDGRETRNTCTKVEPMETYTATLYDCPIKDADKREAENVFCTSIESTLGGVDAVCTAFKAYCNALDLHEEFPLPATATPEQRAAVALWMDAESVATQSAFSGWHRCPDGAHFEIELTN